MKTVRQAANVSFINFCIFTKLSSLSLGFVIASLMSPSAFSDWLYVLDQEDDSLVRIDPDSFETVVVGPVGFNVRFGGMTWHPELRKLLVANDEQGSVDQPTIYSIDVDTGLSEQLGNVDVGTTNSSSSYGLAYDEISGGLYISFADESFDNTVFRQIDLDTMTSSTVAFAEVGHVDSLTAYSTGGELIGVQANVFSDPVFHSINTTAGSVEQLCAVELPESFRPDRPDLIGFNNGGLAYDSRRNVLWHVGLNEPLARVVIGNDCSATIPQAEQTFGADAIAYVPGFSINPGLNDAWYNPDTDGQGFYIVVFGDTKTVSLAWFTYDTEQPTDNAKAVVGDPGHRWLTAFGTFDGTTATLDVVNTIGGSFDDGLPAPSSEPFGTIDLSFDNCESGRIEYEFPGPDLRGSMPIQRVADTNVALCEKLSKAPSIESIH